MSWDLIFDTSFRPRLSTVSGPKKYSKSFIVYSFFTGLLFASQCVKISVFSKSFGGKILLE